MADPWIREFVRGILEAFLRKGMREDGNYRNDDEF